MVIGLSIFCGSKKTGHFLPFSLLLKFINPQTSCHSIEALFAYIVTFTTNILMSAMSSAVRMAANMSMKVRVDVFSHALRFFFCENSPSLFVHRRLVLEKSQRASENGRSMCTQYSPNLLFNYSHASFAPVLWETPESLGAFFVVCCWLARFPTFFGWDEMWNTSVCG